MGCFLKYGLLVAFLLLVHQQEVEDSSKRMPVDFYKSLESLVDSLPIAVYEEKVDRNAKPTFIPRFPHTKFFPALVK